mgnify:CR=1 FL=1
MSVSERITSASESQRSDITCGVSRYERNGYKMKKRVSLPYIIALTVLIISSAAFGVILAVSGKAAYCVAAVVVAVSAVTILVITIIFNGNLIKYTTAMDKTLLPSAGRLFTTTPSR